MTIHPIHAAAVETVEAVFGASRVVAAAQPDGTTLVAVSGIDIGNQWAPSTISLAVPLAVAFPSTPPYPYFVEDGLRLLDGGVPSNVQHAASFAGRTYSQVSLSNYEMRPDETLGQRMMAAVAWFRSK